MRPEAQQERYAELTIEMLEDLCSRGCEEQVDYGEEGYPYDRN